VLLQAATQIARDFPNVHYLLVGQRDSSKEESRQFEERLHAVASESLPGKVHFLGRRDDVGRLLGEATLLAHAARQEPLGRVLLEAAAAGVPVVATDVGGTREIFPPEQEAARLVPPGDADALASALRELLGDAALRSRLGTAARRCAVERFDIRTAVAGLIDHYREVRD
jgi:glycosyltransferase involved in cell wall biosynthesis